MTGMADAIFREYDIRGTYGDDLTPEVAFLIGRSYALYLGRTPARGQGKGLRISVGRDVRLSSNALRDALIKGLTSGGVDCIDLGECPTPLLYFSMHTLPVDGGIMITGSHNPPEYNGFKVGAGKDTLYGEGIQELKRIMLDEGKRPPVGVRPGIVEKFDVISKYVDEIGERFALPVLKRPLRIVVDCGNGTAGPVAMPLLRNLGCEISGLFTEPDGHFPNHHPDPTQPKNVRDLAAAVVREGADFGIAYDGDADRIGVVDESGRIIWGDKLMIIFSRAILEKERGATIVGEVKCSQVMYDEIAKAGGRPVMWKTGHSLIKARMKELKAAMAGEMSGHIFFADRYFGFDDAIYASCRLVEIMAEKMAANPGFRFSALLEGIPETFSTPEIRIDCPDDVKFDAVERLDSVLGGGSGDFRIRDVVRIDGLRINFEGGWALVRASNTQPVLVLRFEATSEKLLEAAKEFIKEKLQKVLVGEALPF